MGRKADIVSKASIVRDYVLKEGGAMSISKVLAMKEFRVGYEERNIRSYVRQLQRENRGHDNGYGIEAWEVYHNVIIGLEGLMTFNWRKNIHQRREATTAGHAEATILDAEMFKHKVTDNGVENNLQELIISALDESNKSLQAISSTGRYVVDVLRTTKEPKVKGKLPSTNEQKES